MNAEPPATILNAQAKVPSGIKKNARAEARAFDVLNDVGDA